jgi:hypothetical protein
MLPDFREPPFEIGAGRSLQRGLSRRAIHLRDSVIHGPKGEGRDHRFELTAARSVLSALASQALLQDRDRGFVQPEDAVFVLVFP